MGQSQKPSRILDSRWSLPRLRRGGNDTAGALRPAVTPAQAGVHHFSLSSRSCLGLFRRSFPYRCAISSSRSMSASSL
jgi:hypothetical protein